MDMPTDTQTPDLPSTAANNQDQSTAAPASADSESRVRIFNPEGEPKQTFAERVGQRAQRTPFADPFGIAGDNVAGVQLFEGRKNRQMIIKFNERPIQPVIDKVKEAGYRWDSANQQWTHQIRQESAMATRIEAKRLYDEVRQMIHDHNGIKSGPEVPF